MPNWTNVRPSIRAHLRHAGIIGGPALCWSHTCGPDHPDPTRHDPPEPTNPTHQTRPTNPLNTTQPEYQPIMALSTNNARGDYANA